MNDAARVPPKPLTAGPEQAERQLGSKMLSSTLTRGHIDIVEDGNSAESVCACLTLEGLNKCLNPFSDLKKYCQASHVITKLAGLIGRHIARDEFRRMTQASTEARQP